MWLNDNDLTNLSFNESVLINPISITNSDNAEIKSNIEAAVRGASQITEANARAALGSRSRAEFDPRSRAEFDSRSRGASQITPRAEFYSRSRGASQITARSEFDSRSHSRGERHGPRRK